MVDNLYNAPGWLIQVVFLLLMMGAIEGGYRMGRRAAPTTSEKARGQISVIEGSLLGILGLLLGFTMSMAVSRFDTRRHLVRKEANAISSAYLRTQLLPEPSRATTRDLLRKYANVRVRWATSSDNLGQARVLRNDGLRLQDQFWNSAVEYSVRNPTPINALLLESLNEAIDLEELRWAAYESHIPSGVIYLNVIVALFAAILIGYAFGLDGARHLLSMGLLALAITLALGMIVDLDRPRCGFIRVSQQPMIDTVYALQDSEPSVISVPIEVPTGG